MSSAAATSAIRLLKVVALKREGKLEEAKEELWKANLLEKAAVQQRVQAISTSTATTVGMDNAKVKEVSSTSTIVY